MNRKLWLVRDHGGSGLYSLWCGCKPTLKCGYWQADIDYTSGEESLLMLVIHSSKIPWGFTLKPGECERVSLEKVMTNVTVK